MNRTGSTGSRVGPAVTTTRRPRPWRLEQPTDVRDASGSAPLVRFRQRRDRRPAQYRRLILKTANVGLRCACPFRSFMAGTISTGVVAASSDGEQLVRVSVRGARHEVRVAGATNRVSRARQRYDRGRGPRHNALARGSCP
jgi:hypothetical protein